MVSILMSIGGVILGFIGMMVCFMSMTPTFGGSSGRNDDMERLIGMLLLLTGAGVYIASFFV